MTQKYFAELAGYNNWTDSSIIAWLSQISEEQWERPVVSSFGSIRQTVLHMVSAKKIWIDFWTKVPDPVYLSATFDGTKAGLIAIWEKASADLQHFIETFPEEAYAGPVRFMYPNGREGHMPFWQTFPHFINHATYHRGQLVTLLRQAAFTNVTNTDLATYFIMHEPA